MVLRSLWTMLMLLACFAATGCGAKTVGFPSHSPYPSPRKYELALLAVIPDDMMTKHYLAEMGSGIEKKKFKVMYGQALQAESDARFRRMFAQYASTTASELAATTGEVAPVVDRDDPTSYTIPLPKKPESKPVGESAATSAAEDLAKFRAPVIEERTGYLLHFVSVDFGIVDDRGVLVVDVIVQNRESGETVFSGRLRGTGQTAQYRATDQGLARELQSTTTEACNGLLLNLRDEIASAIDNDTGNSPPAK